MKTLCFNNSKGEKISVSGVVEEIRCYINQKPDFKYKVIIGTDSSTLGESSADFVTAIVVHRVGNGGKYFWRHNATQRVFNLRDRIIKEVLMSLDVASDTIRVLEDANVHDFDFEVHVDVGANGQTSALIGEVTGMVRAHNFVFKTKPESYAASSVADKHV